MRKLQVKSFLVIPGSSPMAMPWNDGAPREAVLHQIPVNLPAKMLSQVAPPVQYPQTAFASRRTQGACNIPLIILLTNK
jgi:hypothetical protein